MKTSKAQSIVFGLLLLATAQLHAETATTSASAQSPVAVDYVSGFTNSNHPEICYWFFSKDQIQNENYLAMVDQLVDKGLYTMAFITARNGVDFYNTETMHPVFARLVEHAHQRGLKIGLQLWPRQGPTLPLEDCERLIVEGEVTLDANGAASYTAQARGARAPGRLSKASCCEHSPSNARETASTIPRRCRTSPRSVWFAAPTKARFRLKSKPARRLKERPSI